ncbi:MAG: nucleotidyltransferase family protein [Deltaproteobacteria bacterium]|nr:nucleotidyltransferase family protein [Deltaproteobacteria bacterium]
MKTLEEIRRVIRTHEDELRQRYKARVVGIFGSYVRGEQQGGSDLDLLAEFDEKASLLDLGGAQVMLSELLEVKVDLVPREDIRPELRDNIEAEVLAL